MIVSNSECREDSVTPLLRADASQDREELRRMLLSDGILKANVEQPISGRNGLRVPWMFYSWNCSLTRSGAMLMGQCFLDCLHSYQSTQLASFGYTGVPLLMSCLLAGDGRYTGLVIREARKQYGSSRQIEGPADKSKPVVIIDDSLSSGTSLRKGIQVLEEEGFQVEGAVVLVNFPFRGGMEWASALGYRVESIFDVWEDLAAPRPNFMPGHKRFPAELWSLEKLPEGLHPAIAARRTAEFYLTRGLMPGPPKCFDADYDGRGGVYVSFRERHNDNRLARDGFWHFDPAEADPCRDLVLATVKTLDASVGKVTLANLADLKIAATFFTSLEKILPAKLDFARYGIVARSRSWETKMGGALPNSQVYTSEIEQYTHARWRNAKIPACEPHDLYRHDIQKCVEPGEYWLPYGFYQDPATHWTSNELIGKQLTERALVALKSAADGVEITGDSLPDDLIPAPVFAIAVTLYRAGVQGCYVTWGDSLDSCLVRAAGKALTDSRFTERRKDTSVEELGISVSVLHDREWLGELPIDRAAIKLRLGADSMSVQQGARRGFLLAAVGPHFNWGKDRFAKELLRKAGIKEPPYAWSTYQTATWVRTAYGTYKIASGFPERKAVPQTAELWESESALLANYVLRMLRPNALPEYSYAPITGGRQRQGSPARLVHALAALEETGRELQEPAWRKAGLRGLTQCLNSLVSQKGKVCLYLEGQAPSAMADCQLLMAAAAAGLPQPAKVAALAARVKGMFQPDGRITDTPRGLGIASEHDFMPGVALLAVAKYVEKTGENAWFESLAPQLKWYRRRFRLLHSWGMVGWQTQAWAAIHNLTGDPEHADFVFEIADWALDWQHERTGAFISDLSPTGPSFHTGFLTEGIAAAWMLALRLGDRERIARYAHSCKEALQFMNRLIIRPEDTVCMRDPGHSFGGVRGSLITSSVRIDFVSHTLYALIGSLRAMRAGNEGTD
jgi:orotate phosphoribosyltransferase/AMMECR1 domain-containing protein